MQETCDIYIDKVNNGVYKVMGYNIHSVHLTNKEGNYCTKKLSSKMPEFSCSRANEFYDYTFDPIYKTDRYEIVKGVYECGIVFKTEIFREANVVDDEKIKLLIMLKGLKYAVRYKCVIEKRAEHKAIRAAKTQLNKALKNKFKSLERQGETVYLFRKKYYQDIRDGCDTLAQYAAFFCKR
jgi:hypothetical protein